MLAVFAELPVEVLVMLTLVPMVLVPVAVSQIMLVRALFRNRCQPDWDRARRALGEIRHASGLMMMSPLAIRVGGWLWPPVGTRRKK